MYVRRIIKNPEKSKTDPPRLVLRSATPCNHCIKKCSCQFCPSNPFPVLNLLIKQPRVILTGLFLHSVPSSVDILLTMLFPLPGEYDHLPEVAFYMVGDISEAVAKAERLAEEVQ